MDPFTETKEQLGDVMLSGGMAPNDEFMVVPTSVKEKNAVEQLEDLLLETSFEELTGTLLSPPVVGDGYCTIDGVGGRLPSASIDHDWDVTSQCQNLLNFPQLGSTEDFIYPSLDTPDTPNGKSVVSGDSLNIGFCGGLQDGQPVHDEAAFEVSGTWKEQTFPSLTGQLDADESWLTQNTDLAFIERMAVENEQQCELLNDLLMHNGLDLQDDSMSTDDDDDDEDEDDEDVESVTKTETSSLLEDLYREALELNSTVGQTNDGMVVTLVPNPLSTGSSKLSKAIPAPRFHLADHDFGFSKRGRPLGSSTRKTGTVKKEAVVLKKKKRLQNREAALRYRLKKRSEKMEKEGELEHLKKRNQHLKNEKHSLTAEVTYLKELLVEIRTLKGLQ